MNACRMLSRVVLDFAAAAFFSTSRREPAADALLLPLHLLYDRLGALFLFDSCVLLAACAVSFDDTSGEKQQQSVTQRV